MHAWTRPLAITLSAALLATAVPGAAWAGHGDHGWRPAGPGWSHGGHHGHHHGRHHGHGGVWGPLIVGGLIGAAIVGASQAQAQPVPQPVYVPVPPASHLNPAPVAPPLVVAPVSLPPPVPPRVQYYCAPYRAYYPYVAECPVPWTPVPY